MTKKKPELKTADWNILKDAVLSAGMTDEYVKKIPPRLQDHPVTLLLKKYRKTKYITKLDVKVSFQGGFR